MTAVKYLEWIASGLFGFAVVFGLSWITEKIRNKWIKILIFLAKFFLMTYLALCLIAFASPFLWKFNYPLSGIYIALLADCICDVLMAVYSLFSKKRTFSLRAKVLSLITLIVFAYGTINSQVIKADHLQVISSKLDQQHTIIFFSDLHIGSSRGRTQLKRH